VVLETPYEPNVPVTRLECIGYVQKRMGAILKRLVKEKLGTNLHDGKTLGSKARLTQSEIHKLQNYYGLSIRKNVNNFETMMRAVWAIFFTRCQQIRDPNVMSVSQIKILDCSYSKRLHSYT